MLHYVPGQIFEFRRMIHSAYVLYYDNTLMWFEFLSGFRKAQDVQIFRGSVCYQCTVLPEKNRAQTDEGAGSKKIKLGSRVESHKVQFLPILSRFSCFGPYF